MANPQASNQEATILDTAANIVAAAPVKYPGASFPGAVFVAQDTQGVFVSNSLVPAGAPVQVPRIFQDADANIIAANYPVAAWKNCLAIGTTTGSIFWCDGATWFHQAHL